MQPIPRLSRHQWNALHPSLDWVSWVGNPHGEIEEYYSPHYTADWVLRGKIRMSVDSKFRGIEASAGEWIFRSPGKISVVIPPGGRRINIGFSIRWHGPTKYLRPPKLRYWKSGALPELEAKTTRLYETMQKRQQVIDYFSQHKPLNMETHLLYTSLFYDWLISWEHVMKRQNIHWSPVSKAHQAVIDATRIMEQHTLDQPFLVSEIAQRVGVSVSHLTRLFQQEYQTSPKAYWMRQSLQTAIQALQSSSDSIATIASRLGSTRSSFYRRIKSETGKSPAQLRKRTR